MNDIFTSWRLRLSLWIVLALVCAATPQGNSVRAHAAQSPPIATPTVATQLGGTYTIYLPTVRGAVPGSPTISAFATSQPTIAPGGAATLSWSVSGAASVRIEPGIGAVTGSSTVVKPGATTIYTLIASNGTQEVRATVTVTVGTNAGPTNTFIERDKQTNKQTIVIDPQGGTHLTYAYYVPLADNPALVYSYCPAPASSCGDPARWQRVSLLTPVDQVQLALTRDGHPRILARANLPDGSYDLFYYGECDDNCLSAAAWHFTAVAPVKAEAYDNLYAIDLPMHYFALDSQDRPRFVFFSKYLRIDEQVYEGGSYYAQCDGDCTNGANWGVQQFTHSAEGAFGNYYETIIYPALTFTSQDAPRIVTAFTPLYNSGEPQGIYYFGCDGGCDSDANWERSQIAERGNGIHAIWDLALDGNDRPQVVYYAEHTIEDASTNQLRYLTCESDCERGGAWNSLDLGLPAGAGDGVDLERDGQGRPRMAFLNTEDNLQYAWCNGGCENAGSWQQTTVETRSQLEAEFPVAILPQCDGSFWDTKAAMLTLDAQGNPHVAYRGTFQERCYFDDPGTPGEPPKFNFKEVWHTIRIAIFAQP